MKNTKNSKDYQGSDIERHNVEHRKPTTSERRSTGGDDGDWISLTAVSRLLGVNDTTVLRLVLRHRLTYYIPPGRQRVRLKRSEILPFAEDPERSCFVRKSVNRAARIAKRAKG